MVRPDRLNGGKGGDVLSERTGHGVLQGGPGIDRFYLAGFNPGAHGSDFSPDVKNGSVLKLDNRLRVRAQGCFDTRFAGSDPRAYFSLEPGEVAVSGGPRGKGVTMECGHAQPRPGRTDAWINFSASVDNPFAFKSFMYAHLSDDSLSDQCFNTNNCIVWSRKWPMKEGDEERMNARQMNLRAWRDRNDGRKNAIFFAVMEPGS